MSIHAAAAKSLQSCPTLCDPIDGSPPGSPVPGILQARTLEWVAISFSNVWKWKGKVKSLSLVRLSDPMDCSPPGSSIHGIFQARVLEWGAIAFSIEYTCIYIVSIIQFIVLPWWLRWSKNQPAMQETWAQSLGQEDPLEKRWLPTSVFLPGEFYGRKSLAGYSPWGSKGSDMTEWLTIYMLSMYWQSTIYWR